MPIMLRKKDFYAGLLMVLLGAGIGLNSATYSLGFLRDADVCPPTAPANVSRGYCGEYGPATTDQRHRAVFNGIWQGPHDIQVSGLYFYGSGQRFSN